MSTSELREYLLRRQRKEVLEKCRRIAILGVDTDPHSASHGRTEKLLAYGVEVAPVLPGCDTYLGVPCYPSLRDVPGDVDIVQVYSSEGIDLLEAAREAVEKGVRAFWVEEGEGGREVQEVLAYGRVQLVEHESLEREYTKHFPFTGPERKPIQTVRAVIVEKRMTKSPVTVRPRDGIKDAIDKMKRGGFRHLPVVSEEGKLVGMLSDRDIRLIRPSLAFVSREEAAQQLWSTYVEQAAVFDPVTIRPDASLERAAEIMLQWEIGAIPVVIEGNALVGIITYSDLLREFIARGA
jgi:acetoin utilization protein AcuB